MGFDVAPCMIKESETPDEKRERIRQGLHEIRLLKLKEFSTPDLVQELCSRDGIEAHGISESYRVTIVHEIECLDPVEVFGPARIIVVRGDE